MRRILLRMGVAFKSLVRRPFASFLNPFAADERPAILHCCYHKVGTVWFLRVLREVAAHHGMSFAIGSDYASIRAFEDGARADVFLDLGSHVRLDTLDSYVGSHMIRDPRDMAVSGYFYHLWTEEPWANLPLAEHRGMSYKEYLNSLNEEEGLLTEIRRMSFWVNHMVDWDYDNPRMFEIRYEDIMQNEESIMRQMFTHYGFTDEAVEDSCAIAAKYTFKRLAKAGSGSSHLRSGKTGEWRKHFGDRHRALFKELYPGAVVHLGYEADDDW